MIRAVAGVAAVTGYVIIVATVAADGDGSSTLGWVAVLAPLAFGAVWGWPAVPTTLVVFVVAGLLTEAVAPLPSEDTCDPCVSVVFGAPFVLAAAVTGAAGRAVARRLARRRGQTP